MIILHVTFKTKPGMASDFAQAVLQAGIHLATEQEAGNHYYDFYLSAEEEDRVLLLEKWDDQAALDLHCQQPHYHRIGELSKQYVLDTVVEKYQVL